MTQHNQVNAYGRNQQIQMDGREIDKRALLNCANRMQASLNDGGSDIKMYQDALRQNQHLWTMFQVSLTDPDNMLNNDLKVTLLRLGGYVDRVTFAAIHQFNPEKLNSLIDINLKIAAGLAKKPQQSSAMPPTQEMRGHGEAVMVSTSA